HRNPFVRRGGRHLLPFGCAIGAGMADPETLVKEFCAAWARRDVEELLGYFLEDAVYHNMPMAPVSGKDGIREILNLFVPPTEAIEFEVRHAVARGDVVFTERVDRF